MDHGHNFYHRACDVAAGESIVGITVAEDGRAVLEYGDLPEDLRCGWAGFLYDLALTHTLLDDLYPGIHAVSAHLQEGWGHVLVSDGTSQREYRSKMVPAHHGPATLDVVPFDPAVEPQNVNSFWDGSSPSGFMEELRGNFPDGEPSGPHLGSVRSSSGTHPTTWPGTGEIGA